MTQINISPVINYVKNAQLFCICICINDWVKWSKVGQEVATLCLKSAGSWPVSCLWSTTVDMVMYRSHASRFLADLVNRFLLCQLNIIGNF